MRRFTHILSGPLNRLQRRFERSRPGSILIFVIALLVLLALMGTAYIATARQDRFSAAAGNSGDDVNRELANALQAAIDDATASVTQDTNPVTCATPSFDSLVAPSLYLASRAPYLDVHPSDSSGTLQPTWASISRVKGRKYEAIYVDSTVVPQQNQIQYDFSTVDGAAANGNTSATTPLAAWHITPTNLVITYKSGSLNGHTYVFPAFMRWRSLSNKTTWPGSPEPTPDSKNIITEGPFIAGDATGWGVADCAMFKLNATKSLTYYAGIRIVDNASGLNVNTAWDATQDKDGYGNSFNFFTTDVDLAGLLYKANNTAINATNEMSGINTPRLRNGWNGVVPALPAPDRENGTTRADMKWRNAADAMYHEYARRPNFPQRQWGDQVASHTYARAFDPPSQPYVDTGTLVYRGVMIDQNAAISNFEQDVLQYIDKPTVGTDPKLPDSFGRAAMNYTTNPTNRFGYVMPNNVGYWYDWNFNFDGTKSAANAPITFPIAAVTVAGNPNSGLGVRMDAGSPASSFRTPNGLLVAGNPVRNTPPQMLPMPNNVTFSKVLGTGAIGLDTMPSWTVAPHKTSLNTAHFGELWRAYWNVMAEPPASNNTSEMFHVPGVDAKGAKGADVAINQFSNSLRDPASANSSPVALPTVPPIPAGRGNGTLSTKLRFDCYNMLLLRSAIAAVNTMSFRDSSNMSGTQKIGYPRSKDITLTAIGAGNVPQPVTVHVCGNEAQPFITEVYANTNIDKAKGKNAPKVNPKGYIAVQLYNPYTVPIALKQYSLWMVDRRSSAGYPNLAYKPLKLPAAWAGTTLAPGQYLTLENFIKVPVTVKTDATYRPECVQAPVSPLSVTDLYKLFEDPADANMGGELVIMRYSDRFGSLAAPPAQPTSKLAKDYVPVDSFDFTGLKLMQDPNGVPAPDPTKNTATAWHYFRISGQTPDTSWKCVYPGRYTAVVSGAPRHEGTRVETPWDASAVEEPWSATPPMIPDQFTFATGGRGPKNPACYPNPFPGIRLNNDVFSRSTKFGANAAAGNLFPFGGFARVGDVEMIPFIGAYTVEIPGTTPPGTGFIAAEANSISMDSSFADDGETSTDTYENIGRFCPLKDPAAVAGGGGYDDYAPYGVYKGDPNPPAKTPIGGTSWATYTYHWAMDIFDNFTSISNPQDDFLPNIAPKDTTTVAPFAVQRESNGWQGTAPDPIPNGPAARGTTPVATSINNGQEDLKPVEGLINVNTAPWQVLSRIQWFPTRASYPAPATNAIQANQLIAQWIVRYRDVDGGITDANGDPLPHGPFNSLLELNGVFQGPVGAAPADKTKTLRNGFGLLSTTQMPDGNWGNYAMGDTPASGAVAANFGPDFANETVMVTRVSNLLTTRSDSFTVYVVVQGWRNVGTPYPELVVQRRAAMVLDRSGSTPGGSNNSVQSYSVSTK